MMWNFFRGGATVIPGATFIPESRVVDAKIRDSDIYLHVNLRGKGRVSS